MARDAGGPAIAFQLLIYPATDQRVKFQSIERNGEGYLLTKRAMHYFRGHYLPDERGLARLARLAASGRQPLQYLPPAFVLTAGYDPLVEQRPGLC